MKYHKIYSLTLQKRSFGPKENFIACMDQKVPFQQFFRNWLFWLAGLAIPCWCSPPFLPIENDRKWLYQLLPIKYELKLPSEVTPGLLPFRSRYKQCVTGSNNQIRNYISKFSWNFLTNNLFFVISLSKTMTVIGYKIREKFRIRSFGIGSYDKGYIC